MKVYQLFFAILIGLQLLNGLAVLSGLEQHVGADEAGQPIAITTSGHLMTIVADEYPPGGKLVLPRPFGSLVQANWASDESVKVEVHPEPNHWEIRWKQRPERGTEGGIVLQFDQTAPVFTDEQQLCRQLGDGSIMLRADQGHVSGKKLRYEPQTHKNTIGYWVNVKDEVHWNLNIDQPHTFNVGLLSGCGPGQGGSVATISIQQGDTVIDSMEFQVEETGHFQNFRWQTAGTLEIREPGEYQLVIKPKRIAKNALMDVRRVHLSVAR